MFNKLKELNFEIKDSPYNFNNKLVPRVTHILSNFGDTEGLCIWANSLGFKRIRYKDELQRAADIGSNTHECIENFINNNSGFIIPKDSRIAYESFELWWDDINKNNKVEIIYTEHELSCEFFGGTLDALIKINDKIYLCDWKTSNHITSKYFLQLSAYRYMLKRIENIDIDGCIILQLNKKYPAYKEYFLPLDNKLNLDFISTCEETFLSFTYSYLLYNNVNNTFNHIFKGGVK